MYAAELRKAAARELSVEDRTEQKQVQPTFDVRHDRTPDNDTAAADHFDNTNGVASYSGQNSEHIGNGSGGRR